MAGKRDEEKQAERAGRLAAALRRNLRRRKAQAKRREDLSGLDPNRTDTPLNRLDWAKDRSDD
ncbi:hypothetical protein G5B40_18595 [Pikeienuella piscinae]|uniref:Uncharacterized protein n=1 Tax=Pikeienuella piscinae TaxID=2748098 RepID=A0A7L5BVR7_9RHOB|nr:hypothetical protein [Pikeienuella piscinae]QIE53964.1 hypothetical protein G5B40_18595 [Pikeienuella piscinae]